MAKILFSEDHEYIRIDGNVGTVGISRLRRRRRWATWCTSSCPRSAQK